MKFVDAYIILGKIALVRPPIRCKKMILLEESIEAPGFFTYTSSD